MVSPLGEWSLGCDPHTTLAGPCQSPVENVNQPRSLRIRLHATGVDINSVVNGLSWLLRVELFEIHGG